jgi:tetratricopeptide (TPR) repeat protein
VNKDQGIFLLGGILFGMVIGYVAAYNAHRPGPGTMPASQGPTHQGGEGGEARAGTPAGADSEALMQHVTEQIGRMKARLQSNPRDLEALIGLGNAFYDAGKFKEAIEYYTRAVEIDPSNPDVISDLGVSYRGVGEPRRAVETFRRAIQVRADHWQSWLNIAIVSMFDLNELGAADEALRKVEALQPNLPNLKQLRDHLQHLRQPPAPAATR